MASNQEQISQNLDHDIEQLENIIQQLRVEIDNINANVRCRHLAHITIRFLNILILLLLSRSSAIFNCLLLVVLGVLHLLVVVIHVFDTFYAKNKLGTE